MPLRRRGYTLFEMVIVLALIVLLAGLAIPAIESMYADYKLQSAVDQVSGKWSQMRTRAILEGRAYRFGVRGDSDFRVAPDDGQYWGGGDNPAPSDSETPPLVVEDSLPRGIQFSQADAADAAGPTDASNPTLAPSSGAWNTVAVFLPDGTAQQDVEIVFRMPNCAPLALKLRALTGGVSSRRLPADGPGA